MQTYQAVFFEAEPGERSAEWVVVRWGEPGLFGGRTGETVRHFDLNEHAARAFAAKMNEDNGNGI